MAFPKISKDFLTPLTRSAYTTRMNELGERIRRLREAAKLTQVELATRAGVSLRNVQNWEQGHRTPRVERLLPLAHALGVTVDALLTPAILPPAKRKPSA